LQVIEDLGFWKNYYLGKTIPRALRYFPIRPATCAPVNQSSIDITS
jgi:hypothetical protein